MKVTIVTPISKKSAIARVSRILAQFLEMQQWKITIIASEETTIYKDWNMYVHYSQKREVRKILEESDVIIYQLGDNWNFSAGVLAWINIHPGVLCLHDYDLSNVLEQSRINNIKMLEDNKPMVGGRPNSQVVVEEPARFALGVFTHSAWGIAPVVEACPGPVWIFPLCHPKPLLGPEGGNVEPLKYHNAKLRILTFGHINPNKKVDQIMEAIGLNAEIGKNVSYRVVGPIESALLLKYLQRAAELGIDVAFLGEVSDEDLDRELQTADVVVALRWPPLEAGSASVIEALWNGKPTIVTDAGCYRDLPDDVVIKISPDNTNQLGTALVSLLNSPDIRTKMGLRAQAYARLEFSPEIYAGRVAEFCEVVLKKSFAMKAGMSMVRQLGEWGMPQRTGALQHLVEKWNVFS